MSISTPRIGSAASGPSSPLASRRGAPSTVAATAVSPSSPRGGAIPPRRPSLSFVGPAPARPRRMSELLTERENVDIRESKYKLTEDGATELLAKAGADTPAYDKRMRRLLGDTSTTPLAKLLNGKTLAEANALIITVRTQIDAQKARTPEVTRELLLGLSPEEKAKERAEKANKAVNEAICKLQQGNPPGLRDVLAGVPDSDETGLGQLFANALQNRSVEELKVLEKGFQTSARVMLMADSKAPLEPATRMKFTCLDKAFKEAIEKATKRKAESETIRTESWDSVRSRLLRPRPASEDAISSTRLRRSSTVSTASSASSSSSSSSSSRRSSIADAELSAEDVDDADFSPNSEPPAELEEESKYHAIRGLQRLHQCACGQSTGFESLWLDSLATAADEEDSQAFSAYLLSTLKGLPPDELRKMENIVESFLTNPRGSEHQGVGESVLEAIRKALELHSDAPSPPDNKNPAGAASASPVGASPATENADLKKVVGDALAAYDKAAKDKAKFDAPKWIDQLLEKSANQPQTVIDQMRAALRTKSKDELSALLGCALQLPTGPAQLNLASLIRRQIEAAYDGKAPSSGSDSKSSGAAAVSGRTINDAKNPPVSGEAGNSSSVAGSIGNSFAGASSPSSASVRASSKWRLDNKADSVTRQLLAPLNQFARQFDNARSNFTQARTDYLKEDSLRQIVDATQKLVLAARGIGDGMNVHAKTLNKAFLDAARNLKDVLDKVDATVASDTQKISRKWRPSDLEQAGLAVIQRGMPSADGKAPRTSMASLATSSLYQRVSSILETEAQASKLARSLLESPTTSRINS